MAKRDYYDVLEVSRNASSDEVKKSYRKLALKFHPDKNPGNKEAEESFKEATEAYQILSNPEAREKYNQFGHAAFSSGGGGWNFGDMGGFADEVFGDLFGAFFGTAQGGRSRRSRAGRDLLFQLEITLEEAASGVEKEITVPKPITCGTCKGSRTKSGSGGPTSCRQCGGSGQLRVQQGFFAIARTCNVCGGEGQVIENPCATCSGSGHETSQIKLQVKIPAGIDSGQRLKLRGEGEPAPVGGSKAGDLYVAITVQEHPVFYRQETEILSEIPVSYAQAVLGGDIEVPTLEGKVSLKIPAGTPSGKTFRLRGKGIVDMSSGRKGDQHVRAYVYVPKEVTPRHRELLEELAKIEGIPVGDGSRTFFDKVKDFFE